MERLKINDEMTLVYKSSVTGRGLYGFLEEMSGVISEGKDLDDLIQNILDAKRAVEQAQILMNEFKSK